MNFEIEAFDKMRILFNTSFQSPNLMNFPLFRRNFDGKFLVGRDGQVYTTDNDQIELQVQQLLDKPVPAVKDL